MAFNPFKTLLGLLDPPKLQVGEVIDFSNGVATIQLPGGGITSARGDVTIGDRVFFQGEVIQGTAPSLTYVSGDV